MSNLALNFLIAAALNLKDFDFFPSVFSSESFEVSADGAEGAHLTFFDKAEMVLRSSTIFACRGGYRQLYLFAGEPADFII